MPRSPQNCRTTRSQPIAAKHRFCTMAGFVDAPAWSSASCATLTLENAEEPCLPGAVQALHRLPRFPVVVAQAMTDRGPMQDVGVEVVDAEVLQRAREGLFDLRGEWRVRVIRETVILAVDVGELRLEEDVLALETGGSEGGGQGLADAGFVVVAPLVGGVAGAKAGVEGHPHEAGGRVFLPGGAVEEGRDADVAHGGVPCWLPVSLHGEAA